MRSYCSWKCLFWSLSLWCVATNASLFGLLRYGTASSLMSKKSVLWALSCSSSTIMLWKILQVIIISLMWLRSQPYAGPLITTNRVCRTPNAHSISLHALSCWVAIVLRLLLHGVMNSLNKGCPLRVNSTDKVVDHVICPSIDRKRHRVERPLR